MNDWTPSDAQISAAQQSLMEVKEVPGFGVHVPKTHIRAALQAAHAAADPVDTTELDEVISEMGATLRDLKTAQDWGTTDDVTLRRVEYHAARQRLRDLFVKAAAR